MKLFHRLIFLVLLPASISGAAGAQDKSVKASIEVVMDGKSYPSLHAYQLDRLKLRMRESFSGISLQEFNDHELISLIGELRQEQTTPQAQGERNFVSVPGTVSPSLSFDQEESNEDVLRMEEMLQGYSEKHGKTPRLILAPEKIKTITIPSSP